MKTFEYEVIERVRVRRSVEFPNNMRIVSFKSVSYGHDYADRKFTFAVPENCDIQLKLEHGDKSDNWQEELAKLPADSLVLDEDAGTFSPLSEY